MRTWRSPIEVSGPTIQFVNVCLICPGNDNSASSAVPSRLPPFNTMTGVGLISVGDASQPDRPSKAVVTSPYWERRIVVRWFGALANTCTGNCSKSSYPE